MEKILVAIDGRFGAWAALSHACSLAKRMQVELNVLLVQAPISACGSADAELAETVRKRLELLLAGAKTEGLVIHYYMTEGGYEDEVIDFVTHHRITLVVYETRGKDARAAAKDAVALRALRHRLTCRMEVVAPIKTIAE